ncbi:MAG: tRNA (guanine(26)-N(2))-dimethyltransferase [Salinirussus sp.]
MDVEEGGVKLRVPEQPAAGAGDPVFFNPDQELNRDITIAALRAYRALEPRASSYLDATAATGVRGVRAAADGWTVTCCDTDDDAIELCRANFEANALDGTVHHGDANVLLHERTYDIVDLDPFGSPMPFADAAVRGTRNLLCVTATDLAPLCGAHFDAGVRRYGAVPRNTEYHGEMGLRVLISALVRTAARHDIAARPLLSHATRHYARTYLDLERSASHATDVLDELGAVYHCDHCLYRTSERGLIPHPPSTCPVCGEPLKTASSIWLARTTDPEFATSSAAKLTDSCGTADRAQDLLDTLAAELDEPTHYDQHRLCKRWNRSAGPMAEFLDALRDAGHAASRTHYGGTTFKTDATVEEIRTATEVSN